MIRATAILIIWAGAAQAGLEDCTFSIHHHAAALHRDLGGGIVSYEQSFLALPENGQAQHVVEDCRSGNRVITVMRDFVRKSPDLTQVVRATFDGMVRSSENFGLDDVRGRLAATGAPSNLSAWNRQSCACAQAYPDLRLGKDAYQKPPVN